MSEVAEGNKGEGDLELTDISVPDTEKSGTANDAFQPDDLSPVGSAEPQTVDSHSPPQVGQTNMYNYSAVLRSTNYRLRRPRNMNCMKTMYRVTQKHNEIH